MSHNVNFIIETEILNKKKRKRISSEIKLDDLTLVIGDRGMTISEHKVPFKSFVKNFGVGLAKILGASITTGLKSASSVSLAASTYMGVSEGAITSGYSRKGIWVGDKLANTTVPTASVGAVTAGVQKGWLTGNVGNTTGKNDVFLRRKIEAQSTSLSASQMTNLEYGAVSFTMVSDSKFQIRRRFFNNRGASVKINEVALGTCLDATLFTGKKSVMLARDMFEYNLTLRDQQYLDIIYTIELPTTGYLNMNFLAMLANILRSNPASYAQVHTMKNRLGDWLTPDGTAGQYSVMGLADDTEVGIQVGSNEDATQSYYAYKLERPLSNAVMDCGAMGFLNELNNNSNSTKFGFYRDFTNASGISQTIYEGGLANLDSDTGKSCFISYFPLNLTIDPNDVLRIKVYFEMPVSGTVIESEL